MCACRSAFKPGKNTDNYFNVCRWLLNNGVDINSTDYRGESGFYLACRFGLSAIVELLIAKQANVNRRDYAGHSPLMSACHGASEPENNTEHYINVCKLLLDNGADIDATNHERESVLYLACRFGLDAIVELLIAKQPNVNKSDKDSESPVMCACRIASKPGKNTDNYFNVCRLLLDNGADVNAANDEGDSALQIACYFGLDAIVELLIAERADVNQSDMTNYSSLLYACRGATEHGKHTEQYFNVCERLLDNGAEVDATNDDGPSGLQ